MSITLEEISYALITGGSRGIGRAVAVGLAKSGVGHVIVNYLENEEAAHKTCQLIESAGSRSTMIRANLAYPQEISALFGEIRMVTKNLNAFVHCAAMGAFKPLVEIKPNQWDISLNTNARSFLLCVQQCLTLMKRGQIVALSSLGARRALPNYGAVGPSKAALEAVIRQLAMELAPRGIRVNGVSAGLVPTDSMAVFPGSDSLIEEVGRRTPAGRVGEPGDIANVVISLLSSGSGWIWGQTIIADGGLSLL